ncbi:hypothetical protein BZL53_12100 [Flavobacterium columnare]|uniref:hypothetical protein n=1 Tax=Flavobacterium columnare TaxID=996 RepID=UPI00098240FD|nr:hypothetical protein [Flavobacterium columnare]OOB82106.1 hypothetical protein BZL53_12100 [Flavobacterium columnare]
MLKNSFLENLNKYKDGDSLYNKIISFLANRFSEFADNYDFDIEIDQKSASICVENKGVYLFVDLDKEILNLRFIHSEFYIFINEINLEELKTLLDDFLRGKYILKTFLNKELIAKQELIFNNPNLIKYNQLDIYGKNIKGEIIEQNGYNWIK